LCHPLNVFPASFTLLSMVYRVGSQWIIFWARNPVQLPDGVYPLHIRESPFRVMGPLFIPSLVSPSHSAVSSPPFFGHGPLGFPSPHPSQKSCGPPVVVIPLVSNSLSSFPTPILFFPLGLISYYPQIRTCPVRICF